MTLTVLPNAERLLRGFLLAQAEITNLVPANRIYSELPRNADVKFPLIRFTRYGGQPALHYPLWLDEPDFQIDCYGGSKAMAEQVADTIRAAIAERAIGSHSYTGVAGTITGYAFGMKQYLPDETFSPPKPRYIIDVTLGIHP